MNTLHRIIDNAQTTCEGDLMEDQAYRLKSAADVSLAEAFITALAIIADLNQGLRKIHEQVDDLRTAAEGMVDQTLGQ